MALTAEQLTVVRSSLDPSGFVQGMQTMQQASKDATDSIVGDSDRVVQSTGKVTRAVVDSGSSYERVKRSLDPAYASAVAYGKTQDTITRAVQNGRATQDDANRLLDLATVKYGTLGAATEHHGTSTRATTMLVREATRSFAEMAAGMNPLEIALLNIGHVEHAFESFGSVVKQTWGFLTSGPAIVLEVAAALGTMAYVAETNQRALNDMSNRLALTRDNFASLAPQVRQAAKELAAMSTLTTPQASLLLTTVYAAPIFQGSTGQASDIARTFSDLNIMLGESAADAKHLAEAFTEPSKVLQELADRHVVGFTQALVNQAREYEASGDKAAAMSLLLDQLKVVTKAASENLTPLQKAIHDVDAAFIKATGSSDGLVTTMGTSLTNGIAAAVEGLATFIGWIDKLTDFLGSKQADKTMRDIQQNGIQMPWWVPLPTGSGNTREPFPWNQPATIPGNSTIVNNNDAVGMFQLRQGAASDVGMSSDARFNYSANIAGGVSYFRQQLDAMHGNIDDATRAYNQGAGGAQSGKGYDYLSAVRGQSAAQLDPQVQQDIARVFSGVFADYGNQLNSPAIMDRIFQIALQESGGHHYGSATKPPGPVLPGVAAPGGDTIAGSAASATNGFGLGSDANGTANAVDKLFQSAVQFQRIDLEKQIEQFSKFRDSVGANSDAGQHASAVIQDLQVKLSGLRDPLTEQEKIAQTARDAVAPLIAESGAARDLLAVYQRFAQLSRDTHQPIDQKALTSALADEQRKLSAAADETVRQSNLQAAGQERLTPLLEQGGIAAEFAANHEKALVDARKTAVPGTAEYARQVDAETAALNRGTRAKTDNQAATDIHTLQNEMQLLQLETSLLGASTEERNREIAALQERQKLGVAYGSELDDEQRKVVNAARSVSDYRTALQQQSADMNELANSFSQSFDTIGQGIVTALVSGKGAAVTFQNVMTSVAEEILREFLKLSVLNPLLNSLFPGTGQRPTIGSVFGTLASASSSGANLAAGSPGLLSGIGGLFPSGSALSALFTGGVSDASLLTASAAVGTFLHSGGVVGAPGNDNRLVPASVFAGAPRYHAGLGSDEFAAILQRGERVLTGAQQQQVKAAASGDGVAAPIINFHITTPDADSFRASQSQIMAKAHGALMRANRRS